MTETELGRRRLKELTERLRIKPGSTVRPKDLDPGFTAGLGEERGAQAQAMLQHGVELLADYQDRLAAQDTHAVLVVLQGMDAAGKDSTIKHVMSGVNPQGVEVHSFKVPSYDELNHDYLWRYAQRLPPRGKIGIFNRSHYEEVLVVRVHSELLAAQHLPPETRGPGTWRRRFREINDWERYLADNGIHLIKLFLNISREEQRKRFLARIERPEKNWKFTAADVRERAYWDDYQKAYADVLNNTSTESAPWHVIPADHKWFAHIAAAAVIAHELITIDPQYPKVDPQAQKELEAARRELLAESASKPT
ncbi:MAG TPA: polyphosphate kinase 2 family protein [Candidatus Sulfotelmatobacter sp.]|nr:polyphosphate kinase 2 family protein [Candidatus Sulfotelmatobacter sp.]